MEEHSIAEPRTWTLAATPTTHEALTFYLLTDDEQRVGAAFYCTTFELCSGVRFPLRGRPQSFIGNALERVVQGLRDDFRIERLDRLARMN